METTLSWERGKKTMFTYVPFGHTIKTLPGERKMTSIKEIIANLETKRERQARALRDTEHHITMLEKLAAQPPEPTPIEDAIKRLAALPPEPSIEAEKKGPTRR